MEKCEIILSDIESCKDIIKKHMDALRAFEAADVEMLEDLNNLKRIFKKEVSLMEKKIKARELSQRLLRENE